uniref:Uncharacterized protein n=1 Tax=Poecilia mexicana TaxID=48701 RepID=A0A3B3YSJ4_9TELE
MVTKKVRTEYMKKFRDPKWETFSKCYEDSLKYRLTRRVMEHSHKPWIWEGWETASNSSGWSTPRLTRNKVAPLSLPPPPPLPPACSEVKQKLMEVKTSLDLKPEVKQTEEETGETPVVDVAPTSNMSAAGVQTQPNRRSSNLDRRRARSADLEKTRRSQLTMAAADDRWMTEYMRCFSARSR